MTKPWNPSKPTVALKPSRIRRDPVQLQAVVKAVPVSPEREIAGGVAGMLMIAGALVTVIIGASALTIFKDDPAADAQELRFGQCYNGGANCVVDGGTIYARGEKLRIAGIEVPQIQGARCDAERDLGIDAAVQLAGLLNGGRVTAGPTFNDEQGRAVRTVTVNGKDVAKPMIAAGLARKLRAESNDWCAGQTGGTQDSAQ